MGAKLRGNLRIGDPHADVDLQSADAEIEQHRAAIGGTQRVRVRSELGQHRTPVHGTALGRQAERNPVAPAVLGGGLECDQLQVGQKVDAHAAARRRGRQRIALQGELDRLVRIARELRNGAKGAEAPLRLGIRDLPRQEAGNRFTFAHDGQPATEPGALAKPVPIIESRVTSSASLSSLQPSVPGGPHRQHDEARLGGRIPDPDLRVLPAG